MGIIGFLVATESSPYTYQGRIEAIESMRDLVASGGTDLAVAPSPIFDPNLTVDWIKRLVDNNMWNG
jgi:phage major head subunit gpT-like protein